MNIHCDPAATERAKYDEMWRIADYDKRSPGKEAIGAFMTILEPKQGSFILDAGCGAGAGGLELENLGMNVTYLDITDVGLRPEVDRSKFIHQPLWFPVKRNVFSSWDYGYCCDVMEHIPPEFTMLVVSRLVEACRTVFFRIANFDDAFGDLIRKKLHLTVMPFTWWRDHIASFANVIDARDLCGISMFIVERK